MSKRKVTFQDGDEEFNLDDEVPKKKVRDVCEWKEVISLWNTNISP